MTHYADDLLETIDNLNDWLDRVKLMQNNWIGKSLGAKISFKNFEKEETIDVFTTRPDTIFGASFIALAPSHPISLQLCKQSSSIKNFINECNKNSTSEAVIEKNEKKGIYTNLDVLHLLIKKLKYQYI